MKVKIQNANDLKKLIAYARTTSKVVFELVNQDWSWLYEELKKLSDYYDFRFEIIEPNPQKQIELMVLLGVVGGTIGYVVAGVPGIIIGGVAGACSGYALSHIKIKINPKDNTFELVKE
jgi:hypothetical protein